MAERIYNREDLKIKFKENENLYGVFEDIFRDYGEKTAIKYMVGNEVVNVPSTVFFEDIKRTASELVRMGFYRRHMGIIGKNTYEWLVICYAAMYSGCIAVPLSQDLRSEEIEELCNQVDVEAVFYDEDLTDTVRTFSERTGKRIFEMKAFMSGAYVSDRVTDDGTINNRTTREDTIYILFTSGTTGKSKGVVLKNSSFIENFRCLINRNADILLILPFHHIAGISVACGLLGDAAELHIGQDPKQIIRYLSSMESTVVFVVPALLSLITTRLRKVGYDQRKLGWKLKMLSCGAASFPAGVITEIHSAGIEIEQYYGATESTGGFITGMMTEDNPYMIGNLVVPSMEAKIMDGELVVKGPRVFKGYYNDKEATDEVLIDGWYHTGDLARVDSHGAWYLTGRKKNLIILSNGENISPEEIEHKLSACHDIDEVVVYGEGEFLNAEIFPLYELDADEAQKEETKQRIRDFVDSYNMDCALYKRVPFIKFRSTPFKKNASGKILRSTVGNRV